MMFRELKARKAKFGFDLGIITINNVVEMGEFVKKLRSEFTPEKYMIEDAGYKRPEAKIYTDQEEVAEWIRKYT